MVIYFGADHQGFNLKESLKKYFHERGYEVADMGNDHYDESDDYPDFAKKVGDHVSRDPEHGRGVVICGSGVGADIVVNKYPRVRSALAISSDHIYDARRDDDINAVAIAANFIDDEEAKKIVQVFLETEFSNEERHRRRLGKISEIEAEIESIRE